jgi:hypothetical protein
VKDQNYFNLFFSVPEVDVRRLAGPGGAASTRRPGGASVCLADTAIGMPRPAEAAIEAIDYIARLVRMRRARVLLHR